MSTLLFQNLKKKSSFALDLENLTSFEETPL